MKKKLENLDNGDNESNLNKTINIKNLKLLQNKIMKRQQDMSRNRNKNNIHLKTFIEDKNKSEINDKLSYNNYDKDNPKKIKYFNSNIGKINNKNGKSIKKNKFKLKEILRLAGKEKRKNNNFIFNLKSLKKEDKK